nr:tRNA (adenosine(37)-N6)-threonylcarbamoyltransferase complex dimerization subunit type 1 TsaB [Actinomycetales bacterium]
MEAHSQLAIDTSSGSTVVLGSRRAVSPDPRAHAEQLGVLLAEVLEGAPVPEAVVVGTGPAPFTGLRAGIVTASAFAFARGLPLHGVPSLDAIARAVLDDDAAGTVTVVTDARRREVYAASYRANGADDVVRLGEFYVGPPSGLEVPEGAVLAGPGTQLYPEELSGTNAAVDPGVLARIACARAAAGIAQPATPLYLRRPDAKVPAGRARVTTPAPGSVERRGTRHGTSA